MKCDIESARLMHKYLDGFLTKEEEETLRSHLEECDECQSHFHELSRTISLIQSPKQLPVPVDFTQKVMQSLPTEKSHVKYKRWFKKHPFIIAAAIFFLFLFSSAFTTWNQDSELIVSKQENLIIKGDTVIVPKGVIVTGDLFIKNGNLRIDGKVDGDVTLINGRLIVTTNDGMEGEGLLASTGEVNGELTQINQMFEWIWYKLQNLFEGIFSLGAATGM